MSDSMRPAGRRRQAAPARHTAEQPPRDAQAKENPAPTADPDSEVLYEGTLDSDRLRRRARFLRELSEARALRERVQPRRARVSRLRRQMRMRTFRW